MRLFILDPFKKVYEGNAREVVLPGEDGEVTILDFHQPFIYCLTAGFITIRQQRFKQKDAASVPQKKTGVKIKNGVARMRGNELVVLVELEKKDA